MEVFILMAMIAAAIIAVSRLPRKSASEQEHERHPVAAAPGSTKAQGERQRVKIKYVIDGDTAIISGFLRETTVRLYAIDCPEDGQPWGNVAKAGLIKMVWRRHVHIETHGVDEYGRTLATMYLQRGSEWINVNERMVMLGHAWVVRRYYDQLERNRRHQLDRLERWARSKKVGLWKTSNPIPPWQWRRNA